MFGWSGRTDGRRVLKREINKLPAADDDGGGGGAGSGGAKAWNISSLISQHQSAGNLALSADIFAPDTPRL